MKADPLTVSRSVYQQLVTMAGAPPVAIRAWNGEVWGPSDAPATIVLKHPGALRALLPFSDLTAGEAYIYDDVDIEGDLFAALGFVARLRSNERRRLALFRVIRQLRQLPGENRRSTHPRPQQRGWLHSKGRDETSVTFHYDTGNDFFRQFLDPAMVYSSAAFLESDEPLETAQRRKLDLICRKLQLRPGQQLLDIGCGWGALAIHAARYYGVGVLGVTISQPQVDLATQMAAEAGVGDSVTFKVLDYRDVHGRFDAIASIGMFEHVGKRQLAMYFKRIRSLLEPGGTLLNHGIVTRDRNVPVRPTFLNTYVFPDSELVTVGDVVGQAEDAGFELRDAESLRTSYALTLRHWVANLESNHRAAADTTSETTYRIWRLYMAGAALAFDEAAISVYQLLLHTTDRPWTFGRSHLLAADEHS